MTIALLLAACGDNDPDLARGQLELETAEYPISEGLFEVRQANCLARGGFEVYTVVPPSAGVSMDASQQERGYLNVSVDADEVSVSPAGDSEVQALEIEPRGQADPIVQTVGATAYSSVNIGEWRRRGAAMAQANPEVTDVDHTDYLWFSPVASGDQLCFADSDVEVSVSDEQICTVEWIEPDAFPDDRVADPASEHRTVSEFVSVTGVSSGTCTLQFDFSGADAVIERDISIVAP